MSSVPEQPSEKPATSVFVMVAPAVPTIPAVSATVTTLVMVSVVIAAG